MASPWGIPRALRAQQSQDKSTPINVPPPEPKGLRPRPAPRLSKPHTHILTKAERAHNAHLRRTYGITLAEYNAMLEAQGGGCAICGDAPSGRRFAVDHDHKTGKVRAILCSGCNTGIGGFRDDPDLLERAAKYVREHCVESAWTLAK